MFWGKYVTLDHKPVLSCWSIFAAIAKKYIVWVKIIIIIIRFFFYAKNH